MTEAAASRRRTAAAVLTSLVAAAGGAAGVAWAAATPPPSVDGATVVDQTGTATAANSPDLRRLVQLRHRLETVRRDLPRLLAGIQGLPTAAGAPARGDVSVPPYVPPSAPRIVSPPRAAAPAPAPAPPPATHTSTGASGG
jgi:hypothetical protein